MSEDSWQYVVIEGEPFLARARAYKESDFAARAAWSAFAESCGASTYFASTRLSALQFPTRQMREGWKKPDRKGRCYPAKNSDVAKAVAALPCILDQRSVFAGVPDSLNWKVSEGEWGCGCIGYPWTWWVGWIGPTLVGRIPNIERAVAQCLERHPGALIDQEVFDWTMPAGLRPISKAKFDFMVAQFRLEQEEKQAA